MNNVTIRVSKNDSLGIEHGYVTVAAKLCMGSLENPWLTYYVDK